MMCLLGIFFGMILADAWLMRQYGMEYIFGKSGGDLGLQGVG
jgi:hypothetical protein